MVNRKLLMFFVICLAIFLTACSEPTIKSNDVDDSIGVENSGAKSDINDETSELNNDGMDDGATGVDPDDGNISDKLNSDETGQEKNLNDDEEKSEVDAEKERLAKEKAKKEKEEKDRLAKEKAEKEEQERLAEVAAENKRLAEEAEQKAEEQKKKEEAKKKSFAEQVVDLTNAERKKAKLPPLKIDNNLMKAALAKSVDMYDNNYFAHEHEKALFPTPWDFMEHYGVKDYRLAGENIASGYTTPESVVKGWMESPGHRENILNPNYTHIGVGEKNLYWTQHFISK